MGTTGPSTWDGDMGRSWARLNAATDRQLMEVGTLLLERLAAQPGERVLDLGCGGGTTTLAIGEAVGPEGQVTGLDISPDLAALARERARSQGLVNVEIVVADAETHEAGDAARDALASRHGCMFFRDGAAAFANLRRGLRPGARVVMTCFAPAAENPWATVPAAAAESVLGKGPPPDPSAPGPFAWADPEVPRAALTEAGFAGFEAEGHDVTFTVGAGRQQDPVARACELVLTIGPVARRVAEAGGDAAARVRPALAEALAPHVREGWVRLGARIWLITATA